MGLSLDERIRILREYLQKHKPRELFGSDVESIFQCGRQSALYLMNILAARYPNEFVYILGGKGCPSRLLANSPDSIPRDTVLLDHGVAVRVIKSD